MEYVVFISIVAATGLVMFLVVKGKSAISRRSQTERSGLEPAPPFKLTVSGLPKVQSEEEQFKAKLDSWQSNYFRRQWRLSPGTQGSLKGERYKFVPPEPRQRSDRNGQVFELLPD
jgi:hypothetical protein